MSSVINRECHDGYMRLTRTPVLSINSVLLILTAFEDVIDMIGVNADWMPLYVTPLIVNRDSLENDIVDAVIVPPDVDVMLTVSMPVPVYFAAFFVLYKVLTYMLMTFCPAY